MLCNTGGAGRRTKDACTRETMGKTRCARNEGRNGVFVAMGRGRRRGEGGRAHMSAEFEIRDIEFTPFLF